MKIIYDWDKHTETHICSICGYKHTKEMGVHGKAIEGDDEFIEMEDVLHSQKRSSYFSDIRSHSVYACPKCGTLQIEV